MCMQVANVSANKISTIPRQCHPAAITQMVIDGLRCPLGDAMRSKHGQKPRSLVHMIHFLLHAAQQGPAHCLQAAYYTKLYCHFIMHLVCTVDLYQTYGMYLVRILTVLVVNRGAIKEIRVHKS